MQDITEMCDKQSQPETPSPSSLWLRKIRMGKKRTRNDDNGGNVNTNIYI